MLSELGLGILLTSGRDVAWPPLASTGRYIGEPREVFLPGVSAITDLLRQLRPYAHALWRRRWIALATAWGLMLLGSTIVMLLPDQYESSARVYADTDSLMGPLLKGIAVQTDPTQQLALMQATLLSRPNLLKVARSVDADLAAQSDVQLEGVSG